jgi:hypothetical protein
MCTHAVSIEIAPEVSRLGIRRRDVARRHDVRADVNQTIIGMAPSSEVLASGGVEPERVLQEGEHRGAHREPGLFGRAWART